MEQWNDATFARQWAEENTQENPERKQSLDLLLRLISDHLAGAPAPRRVLDLGCGHGAIAARVLHEVADTTLVGVDGSAAMLELASERLAPYAGRFALAQANFETMTPDDLPGAPFDVAIAVQSLHNSTDEGKKRALASVRTVLAPSGLFLLLDRIRLATPALFGAYRSVWDTLGAEYNGQQREGHTLEAHERSVAERGDKPGSLEQNMLWLREAGYSQVAALLVVGVRALIAAS
ncbi:MAG TPA: methyltransferase domain-containing protein [Ktedonobacterales bacterium]|nr:methyltransferase domain-containing protein [Ktedonobacterales bacterium]